MGKLYGRRFFTLSTAFVVSIALTACQKPSEPIGANFISLADGSVERSLGDRSKPFWVMDAETLRLGIASGEILDAKSIEGKAGLAEIAAPGADVPPTDTPPVTPVTNLVLGFPIGLLGENHVFGGVFTKVSDRANDSLGRLKLIDLPPIHVTPVIASDGAGGFVFALVGCAENCGEGADEEALAVLPVSGVDQQRSVVLVDIAPLGNALNLVKMMDPNGDYTKLKTKTNLTTAFDYSLSTLVFDVETTMEPLTPVSPAPADTVFTVRWYLRLTSTFDPAFVARTATDGVGFFMTERTPEPKIQRFALPKRIAGGEGGNIHYYIKGVPAEHKAAFQSAFDAWNGQFVALLGKKLLSYEFVDVGDPRYDLLVTGDIRFNIVEWDRVNLAPYGGLGPSIANQHTGQILSANVLVQGPTIEKLYQKWFGVSQTVHALREEGDDVAADELLRETLIEIQNELKQVESAPKVKVSLGKLAFRVPSQMPGYEDPLFQRHDFDEIPAGFTYEGYMEGYMHELVTHELGHNLGLRHNFRGNLSASAAPSQGTVSHSIMEYLNRNHRHLNRIGAYDSMALSYGYGGKKPTKLNLFCTDEEVGGTDDPTGSAECSRDDAGPDPFGFFESRLAKSITMLTAKGLPTAPVWTAPDMERELGVSLTGLGLYATSAATKAATWTNFSAGGMRPQSPSQIPGYVLGRLKGQLCDAALDAAVQLKTDPAARQKTVDNIAALRGRAIATMVSLGVPPTVVACGP